MNVHSITPTAAAATPAGIASGQAIRALPLSEFKLDALDPALHRYVDWEGRFGPVFDHPLYRDVHMRHTAAMPADWLYEGCRPGLASINQIIERKQQALQEYERERKWFNYVFTHHRPYRADALFDVIGKVGASRVWPLVGHVWTDSESNAQSWETWEEIWSHAYDSRGNFRKGFSKVMSAKDRRTYEALPAIITAYRGCFDEYDTTAYSWTLDREKAEWFARRKSWNGNPVIAKVEVHKPFVLAYFSDRNESEVIIDHINAGLEGEEIEIFELAMEEAA